jgi:beta-glucosidase
VARDARWGRTYESFSENPALVRRCVAAMVAGLQGTPGTAQFLDAAHVIATPKHFIGDGGTGGVDQGDNPATERELRELDGAGYYAAVAAGAQTVMASYSSWRGVRVHGSHALLTEVLKGRMGFDGLVLGDWNGHAQLPGCAADRCALALNAGLDVLMATMRCGACCASSCAHDSIARAVRPRDRSPGASSCSARRRIARWRARRYASRWCC